MSFSEAHATSPDKSSTKNSRKCPYTDPFSETLSTNLEKEEEPITSETLEMIEKLQKVELLQSQIRELRKIAPPSNTAIQGSKQGSDSLLMKKMGLRYQDVRSTTNFVETEDIKAKRWRYLQERRSDRHKDAVFVYLDKP
ncbi:hypothetical protein BC939DRAFT_499779 [Gamsiella multidivaricata]|uniref:uncharacterized protein n=1 Tax=Gamsiella multidivaricata TaxID=101098 RepID=UPI00221F2BFE|nr:uncharacterized protein BC939DRAFT_499779 [Gamsiella multidivaricata]KAI7830296.1 hypothetical protein BC939DRAFT_499779 [Gamsiella multidivaricata]